MLTTMNTAYGTPERYPICKECNKKIIVTLMTGIDMNIFEAISPHQIDRQIVDGIVEQGTQRDDGINDPVKSDQRIL